MRAACLLCVVFIHATFAERYIPVYEGYSREGQPVAGQLTGVAVFDRLLNRLPGTGRISGEHLLDGPIYIQVPREDGHIATYFADKGLGSVLTEPVLRPIRDFLLQDESRPVRGLLYRPTTYRDPHILEINAREVHIPDDFKVGDIMAVLVRNQQIPMFLVASEDYFNSIKLDDSDLTFKGKAMVFVEKRAKFVQP